MIFKKIGKIGRGGEFSLKTWVATILFAAIIIVFAFWGISPDQYGGNAGGAAAVVNNSPISIAEYRNRVDNVEQNARDQFAQFPEEQRRLLSQQLRRRALEELIFSELVYQAAAKRGVRAPDGEVRDTILQIPFLQENGRFLRDRYKAFLQNMNMTGEAFEKQIRKQIVTQKVQELFVGSALPTREELRRNRILANQKVNIRFVEVTPDDLRRPGVADTGAVAKLMVEKKPAIETYYQDNKIEFTQEERVKARHILVRIDDKRPDAEAKRLAEKIRAEVTSANFSAVASKKSDDPGSKSKGGDLGEFSRGRMVPEFEEVAFKLSEGQISDPVKSNFGYHIIWVEKKLPPLVRPLSEVQNEIARKLWLRENHSAIVSRLRGLVEAGKKAELDGWITRAGLSWKTSGEFDLSTVTVPKLGDSPAVVGAILRKGKAGGLIPQLVDGGAGRMVVVDVLSWKESADKKVDEEGIDRMVAFRRANGLIEGWSRQIEASASIHRNPRLLQ